MIDKTKLKRNLILALSIISLISIASIIIVTLARYSSSVEKTDTIDIAFWFADATFQQSTMIVEDVYPSEEKYVYTMSVANNDGTDRAETDLEYTIAIKTTTNLPLKYSLYKKVSEMEDGVEATEYYTDANDNVYRKMPADYTASPSVGDNYYTITTDTDGTKYYNYFYTIDFEDNSLTIGHNADVTDNYAILLEFPVQYANVVSYQDIVEFVKITVDAKQIID